MRCFACAKVMSVETVEPCPESDCLGDGEIYPDHVLEVVEPGVCKVVVVCYNCFHKIHPDMWIDKAIWDELNPAVPYDKLPVPDHDHPLPRGEAWAAFAPTDGP